MPSIVGRRGWSGLSVLLLAAALSSRPVHAVEVFTGEADGAYHSTFCPALSKQLGQSKIDAKCTTTNGTADNVSRIALQPALLAYGQLDVFALEVTRFGGVSNFTRLRVGDVRECVFAVTRNRDITNYGEVAAYASKLRFVLPPVTSGSAGTFRYLQQIDPSGVGAAKLVINAPSTEEALRMALSANDTVAFFVQFPDPSTPRFRLIQELGGHIVPVLDRNILRQQIEDRKIYFAQETEVTNARWLKSGTKVITACTPLVLFTGANERVTGEKEKQEHKDLIATVVTMPKADLLPREPLFDLILKRTRELSAQSAEQLGRVAEQAREGAKPWIEKAKDVTEKVIEQTGPALQKAREAGAKALEEASKEARDLLDKAGGDRTEAKPPSEPKKQP